MRITTMHYTHAGNCQRTNSITQQKIYLNNRLTFPACMLITQQLSLGLCVRHILTFSIVGGKRGRVPES